MPYQGGELLRRLLLPLEDDEHMPPAEKEQLDEEGLSRVRNWIFAGAPQHSSASLRGAGKFSFDEGAEILAQLSGAVLRTESSENSVWTVDFSRSEVGRSWGEHHQSLLSLLRGSVVELNLSGVELDDAEVDELGYLPQLRSLSLSKTKVRGPALEWVSTLPSLEVLHLYGLQTLSADDLYVLEHAPALARVFVDPQLSFEPPEGSEIQWVGAREGGEKNQILKQNWTIHFVSSEERSDSNSAPARNLIDGLSSSLWSSAWRNKQAKYPHEVVIDLGENRLVSRLQLLARQDGKQTGTPRNVRVFRLDSKEEAKKLGKKPNEAKWEELGSFSLWDVDELLIANPKHLDLSSPHEFRFLRLLFEQQIGPGPDERCVLAEVELYGAR